MQEITIIKRDNTKQPLDETQLPEYCRLSRVCVAK